MIEPNSTSQPPFHVDAEEEKQTLAAPKHSWMNLWESLVRLGLGETTLRVGTALASITLVLLVVWVMSNFYLKGQTPTNPKSGVAASGLATPTPLVEAPDFQFASAGVFLNGVSRLTRLHTNLPDRPRFEVSIYEVAKGDYVFDIAKKFGLKPQTILWSNYNTLADNPEALQPGQKLNILPVDGTYYQWQAGDGLNGVAKYFGVTPEDIINWPGNNLSTDTIGDYAKPTIAAGVWLVIPGGHRAFVSWSAPLISRQNPAVANIMGSGSCGSVIDGPIGKGTFIWPTTEKFLSGYNYSPETNHWGIDIAGQLGNNIWAADAGVVVYAGWNDWGYGNVVVIDHGNGWQTLYAHLSSINVGCGASIYQGGVLGAMGSTGRSSGPHLHFELQSGKYGHSNPMDYLQK